MAICQPISIIQFILVDNKNSKISNWENIPNKGVNVAFLISGFI